MTTCDHITLLVDGGCYYDVKIAASLIADHSPNGHGSPTPEQLAWIGVFGEPVPDPGWIPASRLVGWLEQRDDREPEARGVRYSVEIDGASLELSV